MKLCIFEENKLIIRRGEDANSMFFIISGEVQVESDDGSKIYAEMGQNSFFGEVALFYDIKRTANIRAKTQCTVMELYKDGKFYFFLFLFLFLFLFFISIIYYILFYLIITKLKIF